MWIHVGSRYVNLDHVRSVEFVHNDGHLASVLLHFTGGTANDDDIVATGEEANALSAYFDKALVSRKLLIEE